MKNGDPPGFRANRRIAMKTIETILRLLGLRKDQNIDKQADECYQLMLDFDAYEKEVFERHDGNPMVPGVRS